MQKEKRVNMFYLLRLILYVLFAAIFFYSLPERIDEKKHFDIFTGIVLMVAMLPWVIPDIRKLIRK